jgi:hypothetical protein
MRRALLIAGACVAMYGSTLGHWFVSDDFLNYERSRFGTLGEAIALFSTRDVDFYRPIARLHFGLLAGIVGDRVVVWNAAGLLLHVLASLAAARLAESLTGRRGFLPAAAGVLFAVHFIHVEPVLWASGVTTLYVTLFVLLALAEFRRSRETGETRHLTRSVALFAAALLSKETAVAFVPLLLLTTAWRPPAGPGGAPTPRLPALHEAAPYALLLGAWLLVTLGIDRGGDASPYRMSAGPHVVKNAAFFLAGGFLPLRYWRIQELWSGSEGTGAFLAALARDPALGLPLAAGAVALAIALARGGRDVRGGIAWIVVASAPFLALPGSGERFQYLPSFGACLVIARGLEALRAGGARAALPRFAAASAAVLALFVVGNLDRQADWRTASRWTREIVARWSFFRVLPAEEPVELIGVPERHRSAWVFRNGFPSMVRLWWEGRPYALEGQLPEGTVPARRIRVQLGSSGTVGMVPAVPAPGDGDAIPGAGPPPPGGGAPPP